MAGQQPEAVREVDVGTCGGDVLAHAECEGEALPQRRQPVVVAAQDLRAALVVEAQREQVGPPGRAGPRDRFRRCVQRLGGQQSRTSSASRCVPTIAATPRARRVPRRVSASAIDSCARRPLPGHPAVPRQRDERCGERAVVAELAAQRDRALGRRRAVEPVRDVQLGRVFLEQRRARRAGSRCGEPQHGRVVRERLPVGGGRGGFPRRGRSRRQDRGQVAGLGGVVDQQGRSVPSRSCSTATAAPVELDPADQRQAALDRAARQLVPERDRAVDHGHDAAPLRFGERLEAAEERAWRARGRPGVGQRRAVRAPAVRRDRAAAAGPARRPRRRRAPPQPAPRALR